MAKVVPMSDYTGLSSPSPSHAASDIVFKLGDGTSGIITTAQKNCFSRIIESHIPYRAGQWIPDHVVSTILEKSELEEDVIENVWQRSLQVVSHESDPAPEGYWSELELFVALGIIQSRCKFDIAPMGTKFAGPLLKERNGLRSRPSYKMARSRSQAFITLPPSEIVPRRQSLNTLPPLPTTSSTRKSSTRPTSKITPQRQPPGALPQSPAASPSLDSPLQFTSAVGPRGQPVSTLPLSPAASSSSAASSSPNSSIRSTFTMTPQTPYDSPPPICEEFPMSARFKSSPDFLAGEQNQEREHQGSPPNRHSVQNLKDQPGLQVKIPDGLLVLDIENPPPLELPATERALPQLPNPESTLLEVLIPEQPQLKTGHGNPSSMNSSRQNATSRAHQQTTWSLIASRRPTPSISGLTPCDSVNRMAELTRTYAVQRMVDVNALCEAPSLDADIPTATDEDRESAHHLLVRLRYNNPHYKPPSARLSGKLKSPKTRAHDSNPVNFIFSQKELNSGIQVAIHEGSQVGVIDSLIAMGADVNISREATENLLKRIRGHDTKDQRSDCLKTAAANRRLDIVRLLTSRGADEISLAQGLREAVRRQYPEVVMALLQRRANPNAEKGAIFQNAVRSNRLDIITLLLGAPIKISETYVTANLPLSLDSRNTEVVDLLVEHGADVNHGGCEALKKATMLGNPGLLLAILRGQPSTESINSCVGLLFDDVGQRSTVSEKHLLLEILLCAGARGDICSDALVKAVTAGYSDIVLLLLRHQVSVNYNNAKAIEIAISKADVAMVQLLLQSSLHKKYVKGLFEHIPTAAPSRIIYDITALLLNAGATGTPLDSALIGCVLRNDYATASLLVDYKASIEFNDSQALQMATTGGDMRMVEILLKGHPTEKSLSFAFPLIPRTSKDTRLHMTRLLLRAGAVGESVSAALIEAMSDQDEPRDLDLITLLVDNKADPNYREGKCLQIATRSGDLAVLELLLRNKPLAASLSAAIPYAMKLTDIQHRVRIIRILVEAGACGRTVAQALVDALECAPPDKDLVKLLVRSGADIKYNDGRALHAAIESCLADLVHLILSCGGSDKATNSKALSTTFDLSISERPKKIEILLQAGVESVAVDQGFASEMQLGQSADLNILRLLLSFRGDVNLQKGQALQIAASEGLLKHLEVLLMGNANAESLRAAFPCAMGIKNDTERFEAVQMLLRGGACLVPPNDLTCSDEIQEALVLETQRKTPDQRLIEMLLEYGANPSWNDGEALRTATSSGSLDILRFFLAKYPSSKILAKAVPIALQLLGSHSSLRRDVITMLLGTGIKGGALDLEANGALSVIVHETPLDQDLLTILLQYGANVNHDNGACFLHVVRSADHQVLKLLTKHSPSQKTVNSAFDLMTEPSKGIAWKTTSRRDILESILQAGVGKKRINATLVKASQRSEELPARDLIYLLLNHGASVNTEQGICLQIAAKRGDYKLAKVFLESSPTKDTVSLAFPKIFLAKTDENSLISMTNLFLEHGLLPDVENIGPMQESPLVLALTIHRNAPMLAKTLVNAGCAVNSVFFSTLQDSEGPEYVTPLLWVLCHSETTPSHRDLIITLIQAEANVNAKATSSGTSPLIAAAKKWDAEIVNDLIDRDADIYVEDTYDRTALSYAAERGALPVIERLVKAGSPCADQSLHYAARGLYSKCVRFLLDNGADPDFPSTSSGGRTPLGELCRRSLSRRDQLSDVKSTIRILINAGANPGIRVDGKSVLLLALDNPRPVELTKALLESGLRKTVNDDCHLYTAPDGLCYSPTMYVIKGCNAADVSHAGELVRLLIIFGCADRFYNSGEGDQPHGACGVPQWIIERDRQRQAEIQRQQAIQQAELQRQREIAREAEVRKLQELSKARAYELEKKREQEREEARERNARRRLEIIQQERELLRMRQQVGNYHNGV